MKVLVLSAYAAGSHVHWQESMERMLPHWEWRVLSLPPRHFSWRIRGNPLYWALAERESLVQDYDLVVATSMVDLATLRGLVPPLATIPTVLYFHENQFAYPQDQQRHSLLEAQIVSLYSSLAADRILFNSCYNQHSFFAGCESLLRRLPDKIPAGIIDTLQEKSAVLPVPLADAGEAVMAGRRWSGESGHYPARGLRLLWVGRFEHDKGGDALLLTLRALEQTGLDYELAVVGQQFRNAPEAFQIIETSFASRLVQFGYLESAADYAQLLQEADVVLSTAGHEFQGLAVLEAVAAGCLPAVPDRLVYPELFPPENRYHSLPTEPQREAQAAAGLINSLASQLASGVAKTVDVSSFTMRILAPQYELEFRIALAGTSAAP